MSEGRCLLADGGFLSYSVEGGGPPLLLIRPLGGSRSSWGRFASALVPHARIVTFDHRGTGRSSDAPSGHGTRALADDARQLLDHLGLPACHVYGISLGGMTATWLAIDAPTRVQTLVLASTLPRGLMANPSAWRQGLGAAGGLLLPDEERDAHLAVSVLSPGFRAARPNAVRSIQRAARAHPSSALGLLTLLAAAAAHDARDRLQEIRAETLVLVGSLDPLLGFASERTLLRGLRNRRYQVLRGVGHDVSAEAPIRTAKAVRGMLRQR